VKTLSALIVFVVSAWPAPAVADGGRAVGTATIEMVDTATTRAITSELWFEALPEAAVEPFATRPLFRPLSIARGAAPNPASGKRPLIVVSHGNFGTRYSHGWLAVELVNAGYVVLSTSHPGTMLGDESAAGRYRLWDRSRDVSFAIGAALKHPRWRALIDAARIGFVGHSFGGWTGVSLAGGRYDPARQRAFCEHARTRDVYCAGTLKDDVAGMRATDAGGSYRDDRIKALYVMASGPGQGFIPESLASITVPVFVDTARFDDVLEAQANSGALARQIPGAREVARPVGHFAYAPECIAPVPEPARALCTDPPGIDRGVVHRQVAHDAIRFFDSHLSRK
jgi:predicted dienelactone hydrolase